MGKYGKRSTISENLNDFLQFVYLVKQELERLQLLPKRVKQSLAQMDI